MKSIQIATIIASVNAVLANEHLLFDALESNDVTSLEVSLLFLPAVEKKAKESTYKTDSTGRSRRLYDNGDVIAQVLLF